MTSAPPAARVSVLIPFAIVTLIWGSTWLVIRGQLGVVPPGWSVCYRFTIAGLTMLAYTLARGEPIRLNARGWGFAAVLGLFQFCLNFNFIYHAEQHATSGLVAVVFALLLLPNALFGRLLLGHRLGRQLLLGSEVAIGGIALLFLHEAQVDPHGPMQALTGIALTLGGTLAASVGNVMQGTRSAKRYPMLPMVAASMLLGAVINGALAWATYGPPVITPTPAYLAATLYLGMVASALAFPLYYGVIRAIGPAKAAYSSVLVPVIAMTLSTLFESYRWSTLSMVGGALVIVGLLIALTERKPAR
ncbi:EamA family transporter [Sphingomonas sp. H39-1-10]|uniref:DMT family transporter n=1 Tax=Sphingomonas pollutisoli TaxID=3030829 RepID=UPI0023B8A3DE|nr:EamA family transporter [Sphingomonas pollutisoli]MDF0487812.1 EamA family transporter [Sphingomonas pollutisoli]